MRLDEDGLVGDQVLCCNLASGGAQMWSFDGSSPRLGFGPVGPTK